jgi:hypothetical protein
LPVQWKLHVSQKVNAGIGILVLAMAACQAAPQLTGSAERVQRIEALFPTIERLKVRAYWVDETGCRFISYVRGSYTTDDSPGGGCRVVTLPAPRPFDDQARGDMAAIEEAVGTTGLPVDYFSIEFGADGNVGAGSFFSLPPCGDNYVYDPRYTSVPTPASVAHEDKTGPISSDWYEIANAC